MLAMIFCFGLIALIDLSPLIHKKEWRDVAAFGIVFALAFTISLLNELKIPIPSTILSADELMHQIGINY